MLVGLSGWDYPRWQGDFYPQDLSPRDRLAFASRHFSSLEANGTFYSLQSPTTYRRWYDQTPPGFILAIKGGRYVTHLKRLTDPVQGLANFFASGPLALREKLGPVLWQLPASLPFDHERIRTFLAALPTSSFEAARLAERHNDKVREPGFAVDSDFRIEHALEVRDASYDTPAFYDLAREHDVACVVSDSPTWPELAERTAGFMYVRLHGHSRLYASGYGQDEIGAWAERVEGWRREADVLVYFDNDAEGRAPHDARALIDRLDRRGSGYPEA